MDASVAAPLRPFPLKRSERIAFFLTCAGVLLSPVYVWSSGAMQPAHFLLLGSVCVLARKVAPGSREDWFLALYLAAVSLREILAVALGANFASLLAAAHVMFGYLLFVVTRKLMKKAPLHVFGFWVLAALVVAVTGVLMLGEGQLRADEAQRSIGSFNNPNQLGYFGLLCAAIIVGLWFRGYATTKATVAALALSTYVCMASLSKSAVVAIILLLLGFAALILRDSYGKFAILLWCAIAGWFIADLAGLLSNLVVADLAVYQRLLNAAAEQDSSWAVRGYSVMEHANWSQLLFGYSSWGVAELRDGYEVHSTFMAPIAAYGVVGGVWFLLFLATLWRCLWRNFGAMFLATTLVPVLLYGLAHNGARSPMFWLFAAIMVALARPTHSRSRQWPV